MKRSRINRCIREAIDFMDECRFALPPFALWTPQQWTAQGHECDEIRRNGLGWDVTDFGLGDFENKGLVLFTLRNGSPDHPEDKPYCEKIMVCRPEQLCVLHFHWSKVEDIINRAGADLVLRLYDSDEDEQVDRESPVTVSLDGVETEVPAGERVVLENGRSITLRRGMYHEFWAEGGSVLIGEVSAVNDDDTDNRFARELARYTQIEEDEPPQYYLCNEYPPARD